MIDIDAVIEEAENFAARPAPDPEAALVLTLEVLADLVFKDADTFILGTEEGYKLELYKAVRILEVSNMCTFENYNSGSIIVRRVRL